MRKVLLLLFVFIIGNAVFALDYNFYKLDNGQIVIIKQVKNNPIVTIDTWIKTGSINENDKNTGVSHFLEHLFFKGTKNQPPGEFDKILESKGAITNAATSKDFTHYYVTIPSNHFDLAIALHADMLLNPLIPRKELEKERKVVLEEIAKDGNNPSEVVFDNLIEMLYTNHPYKRKVLGTGEVISKISREEILEYYNSHYAPQNMITIIIGDVEPNHALQMVKENFKTAEARKVVRSLNKPEKPLIKRVVKKEYLDAQSGYLLIGYRGVNAINPNTYALDVLATILGDGRSSVLNQAIKEQKQLAYSIATNNASYKEDGIFAISANFTPENAEKLQKAIFEEISKVQRQGVTQEQLNIAKQIIERDTYYSRESISNISSEIGYTMVLTENPKYYDEYLSNIKKVTVADIKKVASLYLDANKCAISIVLPKEIAEKAKVEPVKLNHELKLIQDSPIAKKYELENKATLLVAQNDLNDIIAMSILAKGGEFLEKTGSEASLAAAVMTKGTQNYSSLELAQVMEENGIKISPGVSADSFSISILTTKAQLGKTLELLDEIVNRATFDDYEIEKTRTARLNSIKKSKDVPMNLALDNYRDLIYGDSVYTSSLKKVEKELPRVQREDIINYYEMIFDPQNLIISVNGNVDAQFLANVFSNIFKQKSGTKFDYTLYKDQIPTLTSAKSSVHKIKDLKTAWLIFGWQTSGVLSQKDYATLQVIDSLLGSGMSSRLFKNVRDQEGLAYQVGSSYSANVLRGALTLYIGTNPKTLSFAKEKMFYEIEKLKTQFVSDKELQEAKEKIIGNYVISQETNSAKASTVGWFEASGRGFDFKDKYMENINSVSASDIIEVANKYFNSNYVISIVDCN